MIITPGGPTIPAVPGADLVAGAWRAYFLHTLAVPAERVRLLGPQDSRDANVRQALQRAATEAQAGGRLWVIWIGHGVQEVNCGEGLITTGWSRDIPMRDVVSIDEIVAIVSRSPAAPVLLIDAEHGLTPCEPTSQSAHFERDDAAMIWGAAPRQYVGPLPNAAIPAFSFIALGGVRGWADENLDGRVTAGELTRYARGILSEIVVGRLQTPTLWGSELTGVARSAWAKAPPVEAFRASMSSTVPTAAPSPNVVGSEAPPAASPAPPPPPF